jgi:hypothetical protein
MAAGVFQRLKRSMKRRQRLVLLRLLDQTHDARHRVVVGLRVTLTRNAAAG